MEFRPRCLATAIGSFPHKDAGEACDLILKSIPDIPIWPQLPAIDFRDDVFEPDKTPGRRKEEKCGKDKNKNQSNWKFFHL